MEGRISKDFNSTMIGNPSWSVSQGLALSTWKLREYQERGWSWEPGMVVPGKRVIPKMEKERQGVSGMEYKRKWEYIIAQGYHNVEKELAEVSTNGKGW